jgi:hypothetical protein
MENSPTTSSKYVLILEQPSKNKPLKLPWKYLLPSRQCPAAKTLEI